MYAGKIRLVGTENGVGVRHAGEMGAGVGGFTLSADGRLEHSGITTSDAAIVMSTTAEVNNSGVIYSSGDLRIQSDSHIEQSGIAGALHSITLDAQGNIASTSSAILAAGVNSQGVLQSSNKTADINIVAQGDVDLQGQQTALNDIRMSGEAITLRNSTPIVRWLISSCT